MGSQSRTRLSNSTLTDTEGTCGSPRQIHELLLQGSGSGSSMTGPRTHSRAAERQSLTFATDECAMTNVFKAKADHRPRGLCHIDSGPLQGEPCVCEEDGAESGEEETGKGFCALFQSSDCQGAFFLHQAFKHGNHVLERTPSCLLTS